MLTLWVLKSSCSTNINVFNTKTLSTQTGEFESTGCEYWDLICLSSSSPFREKSQAASADTKLVLLEGTQGHCWLSPKSLLSLQGHQYSSCSSPGFSVWGGHQTFPLYPGDKNTHLQGAFHLRKSWCLVLAGFVSFHCETVLTCLHAAFLLCRNWLLLWDWTVSEGTEQSMGLAGIFPATEAGRTYRQP